MARPAARAIPWVLVLCCLAAAAQPAEKVHRVGIVVNTSPVSELAGPEPVHPLVRAFVHGLRALGYVEGRNLILERRSAEGRYERFGDIVADLVRLQVDVIVTVGTALTRAAKAATASVPIVTVGVSDPVGARIVQSLARPGGNVTGLTIWVGPEIEAKRFHLLIEMLPGVSRIAYLGSKENKDWESPAGQSVRAAAQDLGVTLVLAEHPPREYAAAFTVFGRAQAEALFVSSSPTGYADRALIVDWATRARLPSSFAYGGPVELGGLMSYGVDMADVFRRAAGHVDKILKGAKPADLPMEQPTKFELLINRKTARELGLTIPPSLLLRADHIID